MTIGIIIVLVFALVGLFIASPEMFGRCDAEIAEFGYCDAPLAESVGQPIIMFSISILILFCILSFLRPEVFKSWSKFALFGLPIGIILIAITSPQGSGSFATPDIDREIITWFVSILFLAISLIIIIVKSLKLRRQGT